MKVIDIGTAINNLFGALGGSPINDSAYGDFLGPLYNVVRPTRFLPHHRSGGQVAHRRWKKQRASGRAA